jgi:hypothetical protein
MTKCRILLNIRKAPNSLLCEQSGYAVLGVSLLIPSREIPFKHSIHFNIQLNPT